jgi:hypothetical protein
VELAVDLEKRVAVSVKVVTVLVARSIVSASKVFADREDGSTGSERSLIDRHSDKISTGKRRVTVRTVRKRVAVACKCVGRSRENLWCGRGLRRVVGFPVAEAPIQSGVTITDSAG